MSSFNTAIFRREFNSTVHLPNVFTKDSQLLPEGAPQEVASNIFLLGE